MKQRRSFNYFYFGILFVLLVSLHLFHISLVEQGSFANRCFYTVHAIGQSFLEIGVLAWISGWTVNPVFVVSTFLLFILQVFDFPLVRLMDMSVWYAIDFLRVVTFQDFIEMLKATSVSLFTWAVIGFVALVLIILGTLFFTFTNRLSLRKPLYFSYSSAGCGLLITAGLLAVFDFQTSKSFAAKADQQFLKALPWKTTFVQSAYSKWRLPPSFLKTPQEKSCRQAVAAFQANLKHRPNIYLFIAESLREDFLTPEFAPEIHRFCKSCSLIAPGISAANATHLSWLSIFHSVYPFAWKDRQPDRWSLGSLPLQLLKQAGYQIHVFSASEFNIYQMDKILFGKNRQLVDTYQVFTDQEAWMCDQRAISHLVEKMENAEEGNLFLVFLEGTHFNYSWPEKQTLSEYPAIGGINYLQISYSKENLEGIKNRYRNAISHIDEQFGRFQKALKAHPKGDEAVVVFTGDHGEEFFEEGRLFHASHLSSVQTRVPIYYQFPNQKKIHRQISSHLDIFPTILGHVFGNIPHSHWFDGQSILQSDHRPFALSSRYNACHNPYEFLITTENGKALIRFDNKIDIRASKALELISFRNAQDEMLDLSPEEIEAQYQGIFIQLFK